MGMVYIKRVDNRFEAMAFTRETLLDLIDWLGDSFIAITNGHPVTVDGVEYAANPNEGPNPLGTGKILFRNVNGRVMGAVLGTFIVKDPMLGYLILNGEQLDYFFEPDTSEPPKMTLIQPEEEDEEGLPSTPKVDIQLPNQEDSETTGEVPMKTIKVEVETDDTAFVKESDGEQNDAD